MIRSIAAALALACTAIPALAQNRPSTPAMSCNQARGLVAARGGIVLGTGGYTFDRFVADRSFCTITESTVSAFAPTRDNPQCFVGYRCKELNRDDWSE